MTDTQKLGPRQQKLVDALRSGKYKQGNRRLRDGDCFCCLGVACDISGLSEWRQVLQYTCYVENPAFLPPCVMNHYGFYTIGGGFQEPHKEFRSLVGLNDAGMPFAEIADIIENDPANFFKEAL
jgi:hypothetical protein